MSESITAEPVKLLVPAELYERLIAISEGAPLK